MFFGVPISLSVTETTAALGKLGGVVLLVRENLCQPAAQAH